MKKFRGGSGNAVSATTIRNVNYGITILGGENHAIGPGTLIDQPTTGKLGQVAVQIAGTGHSIQETIIRDRLPDPEKKSLTSPSGFIRGVVVQGNDHTLSKLSLTGPIPTYTPPTANDPESIGVFFAEVGKGHHLEESTIANYSTAIRVETATTTIKNNFIDGLKYGAYLAGPIEGRVRAEQVVLEGNTYDGDLFACPHENTLLCQIYKEQGANNNTAAFAINKDASGLWRVQTGKTTTDPEAAVDSILALYSQQGEIEILNKIDVEASYDKYIYTSLKNTQMQDKNLLSVLSFGPSDVDNPLPLSTSQYAALLADLGLNNKSKIIILITDAQDNTASFSELFEVEKLPIACSGADCWTTGPTVALIPSPGALGDSQGGGAGDQLLGGAGGGYDAGGSGGSSSSGSGSSGNSSGASDDDDDGKDAVIAQAGGQDAAFVIAGGGDVESGSIVGAAAGAKGGCSLRPGGAPSSTELLGGLFLIATTLILCTTRQRHRQ